MERSHVSTNWVGRGLPDFLPEEKQKALITQFRGNHVISLVLKVRAGNEKPPSWLPADPSLLLAWGNRGTKEVFTDSAATLNQVSSVRQNANFKLP